MDDKLGLPASGTHNIDRIDYFSIKKYICKQFNGYAI
jgi:hypothetical protein